VFVEVGVEPALSGRAADPASDVQSLGRTLYAWLTGREANLDPRESVPTDFALPSRLDRRVPALADALILRALQAGGPRGLKSAGEMVVGLRQVLRSAGAAVSPGEVASWVQKRAGAGAIDSGVSALLTAGKRVELAAGSERRPAVRVADTLVDFAVPAESVPAPSRMPRAEAAPAIRPPLRRISMAPAEATETSQSLSLSQSVSVMQRPRRRRLMGGAMAVILAGGVAVLGYTLGDRVGRPRDTKPVPAAPTGPVAPPLRVLAPPEPPKLPPAPPMPPLPMYDPNAPARPKPPPKRIVHERAEPRLGHGAFLSLEANRVARVFVDGRDTRLLTPLTHVPISPGSHHIRLVAALGGDGTQEFEIHVKRGATAYRYGNLGE
ncbi:MAG TPA: hypothetical protein VMB50_10170, partial [Myxococcales bacterium]|nr:hypothetical protein [Myxococcales bacterium]